MQFELLQSRPEFTIGIREALTRKVTESADSEKSALITPFT
jgi:hypothetical protein